jgi:tRNA G37 N-methylase Trm5
MAPRQKTQRTKRDAILAPNATQQVLMRLPNETQTIRIKRLKVISGEPPWVWHDACNSVMPSA